MNRRDFIQLAAVGAASTCLGGNCQHAQAAEPVSLFDGKTLTGWHTAPRIYVPEKPEFASIPTDQLRSVVYEMHRKSGGTERLENHGVWKVEDGMILGAQVPGTTLGGYLLTDKKYADFDLTLEARPDWPIDTGIMIRCHEIGTIGIQVLLDHRPNGAFGGIYGNGIGGFRIYPFVVNGDSVGDLRVANLRAGKADGAHYKPEGSANLEDFLSTWKPNDWNQIRVRCTGRLPLVETWINDVPIASIDMAALQAHIPGYDPKRVERLLGSAGHIGFEVHDNAKDPNRWGPGAVCRWRNIQLTEILTK